MRITILLLHELSFIEIFISCAQGYKGNFFGIN